MRRLALIATVYLAGCVAMAQVGPGEVVVRERMVVRLDSAWNRYDAGSTGKMEVWTTDGLPNDVLRFIVGVQDGEHREQERSVVIAMREADEHDMYVAETHLEDSGEHEVLVRFHVNGEMLQAAFVVDILQSFSKSLVLWGFVAVNVVLITSAGILKKQSIPVKGG